MPTGPPSRVSSRVISTRKVWYAIPVIYAFPTHASTILDLRHSAHLHFANCIGDCLRRRSPRGRPQQFSLFLLFFPQLSATVCFHSAEILSFAMLRGRRNSKAVGSFAAVSPRFWGNCPNTGTCSMKAGQVDLARSACP